MSIEPKPYKERVDASKEDVEVQGVSLRPLALTTRSQQLGPCTDHASSLRRVPPPVYCFTRHPLALFSSSPFSSVEGSSLSTPPRARSRILPELQLARTDCSMDQECAPIACRAPVYGD